MERGGGKKGGGEGRRKEGKREIWRVNMVEGKLGGRKQ